MFLTNNGPAKSTAILLTTRFSDTLKLGTGGAVGVSYDFPYCFLQGTHLAKIVFRFDDLGKSNTVT